MEHIKCWNTIQPTLQSFYENDIFDVCNNKVYMNIYTTIFNFLSISFNREIKGDFSSSQYSLFYYQISDFLKEQIDNIENINLYNYPKIWENFRKTTEIVDHIFIYFNKSFIETLPLYKVNYFHIKTLSLIKWDKILIEKYYETLLNDTFTLFNEYRLEKYPEIEVINKYLDSLNYISGIIEVDIFETRFTNNYLDNLKIYLNQNNNFIEINQYIDKISTIIRLEHQLCYKLFNKLIDQIDKLLYDILIKKNLESIDDSFKNIDFTNYNIYFAYQLFKKFDELSILSNIFSKSFNHHFKNKVDNDNYLISAFDIYEKYTNLVINNFNSNRFIEQEFYKNFRNLYNGKKDLCLILAKDIDHCIRKNIPFTNLDKQINYLDDSELFIKYYQKFLAKRLLNNLDKDQDNEVELMNIVKKNLGQYNIYQLENMISDIKYSKKTCSFNKKVHCYILKSNVWPIKPKNNIILPTELQIFIDHFQKEYEVKYPQRKLTWFHSNSNGILETTFLKKKYIFMASTEQMAFLVLFNNDNSISRSNVISILNISSDYLDTISKPILDIKLIILEDGIYKLNLEYKSSSMKKNLACKISKVVKKETDTIKTNHGIEVDYIIQAYIVKIMKSKRTINHSNLVSECIQMGSNKYKFDVPKIKKNISVLIEKEYLERQNLTEYIYLA